MWLGRIDCRRTGDRIVRAHREEPYRGLFGGIEMNYYEISEESRQVLANRRQWENSLLAELISD